MRQIGRRKLIDRLSRDRFDVTPDPAHRPMPGVSRASWICDGTALYATQAAGDGHGRYYVIVEQLAGKNAWDWAVWYGGQSPENVRHGTAYSAMAAMADAEIVAREWDAEPLTRISNSG